MRDSGPRKMDTIDYWRSIRLGHWKRKKKKEKKMRRRHKESKPVLGQSLWPFRPTEGFSSLPSLLSPPRKSDRFTWYPYHAVPLVGKVSKRYFSQRFRILESIHDIREDLTRLPINETTSRCGRGENLNLIFKNSNG